MTITYISPVLYKRDSKGKARQWQVRTKGSQITVEYGQVGGKMTSQVTTAKPKNVGRSNETTPQEQAVLEAKSKLRKQIVREDYHEDIEQAGNQCRPMLALDYLNVPHRVDWTSAVLQPKLNGLRLTAGPRYLDGRSSEIELMTRKGEIYPIEHLVDPIMELHSTLYDRIPSDRYVAIDGEIYLHGMPLQTITSLSKKYRPGQSDQLEYHLFDLAIPDMGFNIRHAILRDLVKSLDHPLIKLVDYDVIENEDDLTLMHGQYSEQGYEGVMIRHLWSPYAFGQRSPDLFKYKQFLEDEFKIIDVWADKNGNAMFICEMLPGKEYQGRECTEVMTFDCTPKRTHAQRKEILTRPQDFIGKWITVKYQEFTVDGLPEFPVGLDLRECNERGEPLC